MAPWKPALAKTRLQASIHRSANPTPNDTSVIVLRPWMNPRIGDSCTCCMARSPPPSVPSRRRLSAMARARLERRRPSPAGRQPRPAGRGFPGQEPPLRSAVPRVAQVAQLLHLLRREVHFVQVVGGLGDPPRHPLLEQPA